VSEEDLCTLVGAQVVRFERNDDTARELNQISHLQRRPCALP
jgi:hypothetical protein